MRSGTVVSAALLLGLGLLVTPAILMLMAFSGGRSEVAGDCSVSVSGSQAASADQLSPEQLENAATVVSVGLRMKVPPRAILIALAAAHQESRFRVYANDGRGRDLRPDQTGIGRSLGLPHQAVGTDHGSLGIFQQQWPWWGSMEDLMDPATSAAKFYQRLLQVPGWPEMAVTDAAQAVQRSAFPGAYADDEAVALKLLESSQVNGGSLRDAVWNGGAGGSACFESASFGGPVTSPIPASARFSDLGNFGQSGGRWAQGHTGTDFSAACGTPVVAAHAGTVIVETGEAWAGKWLVKVSTGQSRLTTWYAHMQALTVTHGQTVSPGQQIGEVGTLGNSTGCHLHFEVHPHGGSIYDDAKDPSAWLEQHLSTDIQQVAAESTGSAGFVLASFNVLGHSETRPGGSRPGWAPSDRRMRWTVDLLDRHGVAVIGFQELEGPQKRAFVALAGDQYDIHSPDGSALNSIAWHSGRFALVNADSFNIAGGGGSPRATAIVHLRDRVTGRHSIFVNTNVAVDTRRLRVAVDSLTARYRLPVHLTGDFSGSRDPFCELTRGGLLTSPAAGSNEPGCRPPRSAGNDWIFGTDVSWLGHSTIRDGVVGRVSDHALLLAGVSGE